MKGSFDVIVQNRRIQYKFTIYRNLTILRGDSATGKTTLIDMIRAYQTNGENSGVTVSCKKKCISLNETDWQYILDKTKDSIIFIDEGNSFVNSEDFAKAVKNCSNYFVIATRNNLFNLPYSITEIYGIKNIAGNKYQETKRLYSSFYNLYERNTSMILKPDLVIVEDSNSGFEFFNYVCKSYSIPCISAMGKTKLYNAVLNSSAQNILAIADGAAFGPEIEGLLSIKNVKNLGVYLPESFEWLILNSGLIRTPDINKFLSSPSDYIDSSKYFSWELFFTDLLKKSTKGTYLEYSKKKLNPAYLQNEEIKMIVSKFPEDLFAD